MMTSNSPSDLGAVPPLAPSGPDEKMPTAGAGRPSPQEILADWRLKIQQSRESEKQCLAHGWPDRSKWYEGKADALERCADQLEYQIIPTIQGIINPCVQALRSYQFGNSSPELAEEIANKVEAML